MKLWQQPAQPLPVQLRPIRGETLVSYIFRLADTNELDRPTILLRALGEPKTALLQSMLDNDFDVALNSHSLHRLETFTAIPAEQLRKSLPSLKHTGAQPADIPATRPYRCFHVRNHCDDCVARLPGQPKVRVHNQLFPRICTRHRRWIHTHDKHQPRQVDLTHTPEVLTAHRRYARLLTRVQDHEWVREQLVRATWIATGWAQQSSRTSPQLHARWKARGEAIRTGTGPLAATPLLVFPEAIVLTEILCDLQWRRHVAMADNDAHIARFYRHVTRRLEQPPSFTATLTSHQSPDSLQTWVAGHRHHHEKTRTEFWQRSHQPRPTRRPFPEIRHFK